MKLILMRGSTLVFISRYETHIITIFILINILNSYYKSQYKTIVLFGTRIEDVNETRNVRRTEL